jgi:flagellar protein FlaG
MVSELNMPISNSNSQSLETQKVESRPKVELLNSQQIGNSSSDEQQSQEEFAVEELSNVVTDMNSVAQNLQRNLLFSVDENSGGTFVKVVDKETDETVREIPAKEIREIKARLEEVAGMIFNKSV